MKTFTLIACFKENTDVFLQPEMHVIDQYETISEYQHYEEKSNEQHFTIDKNSCKLRQHFLG